MKATPQIAQDSVIHVLDETVVSQIAAGEVVERPASVVKELIENAIDAQARCIEIEIKDGGQKLIEIVDDGIGMCQADAVLAFSQHATSKISTADELNAIGTLGFRGEALASIASVSRVTLITHREDFSIGTRVQCDGGRISSVESIAHPRGTMIQVKNLFYNIPARRKFMKSIAVEMAQISDIICHYMLGYPELAFRFTRANVAVASSTGQGNLTDAVLAVYGPEITKSMIPLNEPQSTLPGVTLRGFISPPNQARSAARFMTTLVNRRYVRSKLLSQAISKALAAFFPKGRYPVLIFDLRLPGEMVDVNVHPQKTEVRFRDERFIFGLVLETLQTCLSGLSIVSPTGPGGAGAIDDIESESASSSNFPTPVTRELIETTPGVGEPPNATPEFSFPTGREASHHPVAPPLTPGKTGQTFPNTGFNPQPTARSYTLRPGATGFTAFGASPAQPGTLPGSGALIPVDVLQSPRILCQLMNSYLLGEDREGLFIIDQHAAHERILFDTYVEAYREERVHAQPLLFPIPLKLLPSERYLMLERGDELRHLGFSIQQEEDGQFYATAVPILDGHSAGNDSVQDFLGQLLGGWEGRTIAEIKSDLFKMMACKAAIKAGDVLREVEMRSLFEQLLKTKNPFTCPHGRPTALRLTLKQIEHAFLRS
ncbi:MAG: DNA mismatch repair endonuclease MutL [Candidatus Riflebacteria bacterium]|nr:DNA mismatch repair endonuclease MutL [Candidatus Riflebacteria bacterium]